MPPPRASSRRARRPTSGSRSSRPRATPIEHESKLLGLNGIGAKTVDYLKMLCGIRTCAIDVHVLRFLSIAGLKVAGYADAKGVVIGAAEVLAIDPAIFDRCIWEYMKNRS